MNTHKPHTCHPSAFLFEIMITIACLFQVLKALQEAVTNHNLSLQPATPPEAVTATKKHARPNPVHSFQVAQCLSSSSKC